MTKKLLNSNFFIDGLSVCPASILVRAEAEIVRKAVGKTVVACQNLDLQQFGRMKLCELQPESKPRPLQYRYWGGEEYDRLYTSHEQIVWKIRWNENLLRVVHLEWDGGCGTESRDWVVADTAEIANSFILEVERKTHVPGEAILVFSQGRWRRSQKMYEATQAASFGDLVLSDKLKETIQRDFSQFLLSQDRYKRLGITWKRGALFIGPPGNGKTHCVRALVQQLDISSLYVQSLSHMQYTAEQLWSIVFDRARGLRPCVLVLEDLDSLVNDENRSFFLNQLDGFEQNHGLIVLATTNHPGRIDPAIMDRPSRFDRKYHFDLPTEESRLQYLQLWQKQLAAETNWKPEEIADVAAATAGFSFAYMKELVISTVMQWMNAEQASFASVMGDAARQLKSQMRTNDSSK